MAKRKTYAQARAELLERLRQKRWDVKANLKTPHATSPHGDVRLWFKSQAIHYTCGYHDRKNARSIHTDMRKIDADKLADYAENKLCKL